jgi:hypothetical protein
VNHRIYIFCCNTEEEEEEEAEEKKVIDLIDHIHQ